MKCKGCGKEEKYPNVGGFCDSCSWLRNLQWRLLFIDWFIDVHNNEFISYIKEFEQVKNKVE